MEFTFSFVIVIIQRSYHHHHIANLRRIRNVANNKINVKIQFFSVYCLLCFAISYLNARGRGFGKKRKKHNRLRRSRNSSNKPKRLITQKAVRNRHKREKVVQTNGMGWVCVGNERDVECDANCVHEIKSESDIITDCHHHSFMQTSSWYTDDWAAAMYPSIVRRQQHCNYSTQSSMERLCNRFSSLSLFLTRFGHASTCKVSFA